MSVEVQETADEAIMSKLSCVNQGYVDDPFIPLFVPKGRRRSPLINRGYFSRIAAVEEVVGRFVELTGATEGLSSGVRCQIVNLGGGQDTTLWKLRSKLPSAAVLFVELDLPAVTAQKVAAIGKHEVLQTPIRTPSFEVNSENTEIRSAHYYLLNADLRDATKVDAALSEAGLDRTLPTLFLSECVLIYLEPDESGQLIKWISGNFPSAAFLTYEQIHPDDAFGEVMMKNLASRGCPLRGLRAFPDQAAHVRRFRQLGWSHASSVDMNFIFNSYLPKERTDRAKRAEIFDEFEEWHLMSSHYGMTLAVNERLVAPSASGASTDPEGGTGEEASLGGAATPASVSVADDATAGDEGAGAGAGASTDKAVEAADATRLVSLLFACTDRDPK